MKEKKKEGSRRKKAHPKEIEEEKVKGERRRGTQVFTTRNPLVLDLISMTSIT